MRESTAYQLYLQIRREMADGMRDVSVESTENRFKAEWENSPIIGNNLMIIWDNEEEFAEDIDTWLQSSAYHAIAIPVDRSMKGIEFKDELVFMRRGKQKSRAPFLPNFTIRHFSFDNRDLRIDSRKMTSALSFMISSDEKEATEVERYIGGILHMMQGKIWTLENTNENIIAAATYATLDKDTVSLEVFDIKQNFDVTDLLENLLLSTFEYYSNKDIYTIINKNSVHYELLKSLNFDELGRLKLFP